MKKYFVIGFLLFSSLIIFAKSQLDDKTELFARYLMETFNSEIPAEESYYITLNLIDCGSCVQNSINLINQIKPENADYLKVIICYKGKNEPDIINSILYRDIFIDSKSNFYNYNHYCPVKFI